MNGQLTLELDAPHDVTGPTGGIGKITYSPHRLHSSGGFGGGLRYLEHDPIPGLRLNVQDAVREVELQQAEEFGMCPWCGQPLEGHGRRCENEE
jgi:hypothetical protein